MLIKSCNDLDQSVDQWRKANEENARAGKLSNQHSISLLFRPLLSSLYLPLGLASQPRARVPNARCVPDALFCLPSSFLRARVI